METATKSIRPEDEIILVEVVSYPATPNVQAILTLSDGRKIEFHNKMVDLAERFEEGEIQISANPSIGTDATISRTHGGRITSISELRTAEYKTMSGYFFEFSDGNLTITAGAAPFSLFVSNGGTEFGRPEYKVSEYKRREIEAIQPAS